MEIRIQLPQDFPMHSLMQISEYLRKNDVLVADQPDPNSEVYSPENYFARDALGIETILLPDRNVVSRMAQAARGQPIDEHCRKAAAIMAFAMCLDVEIEPSISFHEMAFNESNEAAIEELGWFRVADNNININEWIAAALGQSERISTVRTPSVVEHMNLAKPISRWRKNYVVALKVAELELNDRLTAIERVSMLLHWMRDDFILAGPSITLPCLYFAPNSPPRKRLLKGLRSADRREAVKGSKNAAWDITYLSDLTRRIDGAYPQKKRYILATFDQQLKRMARLVVGEYSDLDPLESFAKSIAQWWPAKDANFIADLLNSCLARTRDADWWGKYEGRSDPVGDFISQGEEILLTWQP